MKFIRLFTLLLFCCSCSTGQVIYQADTYKDVRYYGLSGDRLSPLMVIKDSAEVLHLKASDIQIVHKDGEPGIAGANRVPVYYAHKKVWGKYQWIGYDRRSENYFLHGEILVVHPNLTFTFTNFNRLTKTNKKLYTARAKSEWTGEVLWIKGNLYVLQEIRNGHKTDDYLLFRITTRGVKFLSTNFDMKQKQRRFGKRLRKLKE